MKVYAYLSLIVVSGLCFSFSIALLYLGKRRSSNKSLESEPSEPHSDFLYKKIIRLTLGLSLATLLLYIPRVTINYTVIREIEDTWVDIVRMVDAFLYPLLGIVHLFTLHYVLPRKTDARDTTLGDVKEDVTSDQYCSPIMGSDLNQGMVSSGFYFNRSDIHGSRPDGRGSRSDWHGSRSTPKSALAI